MELSTGAALRKELPSARITIASPFPEIDDNLYRSHGMRVVRSHRRRLIWSAFQLARCLAYQGVRARTGRRWRWLVPEQELRSLEDASLVIDLSGDMLTEDYGPHVALSHFYPLLLALALDRPLYICAQSIGPFKWTRKLARFVFDRASRITVRDAISERYLDDLGVRKDRRSRTADTAFLLPAEPGRERLRALVGHDTMRILGVSLSYLVAAKWRPGGVSSRSRTSAFIREVARMLDRVIDELDVRVVFLPHVTGPKPAKDDRRIARQIREAMSLPDRAFAVEEDLSPGALKGMLAECSLVFGARMHANIAALSSGVPVVAIAYSHKTPGIMRALGQERYVLNIEDLDFDAAFDMIESSLAQADHRKEILAEKLASALERASDNFRDLSALLAPP
jgi:colanic acid/amylovoran biosynthesis protein